MSAIRVSRSSPPGSVVWGTVWPLSCVPIRSTVDMEQPPSRGVLRFPKKSIHHAECCSLDFQLGLGHPPLRRAQKKYSEVAHEVGYKPPKVEGIGATETTKRVEEDLVLRKA